MTAIRVLIVDDHPVVRDGLRGMLAGDPELEVVGEASDGAEALAVVGTLRPDVILMDLRMPGMGGAAAIRALAEKRSPARVLVLTTYDSDSDVVPALEAGATGYLLKDAPRDELVRAIRAAARGEAVLALIGRDAPRQPAAGARARRPERPRARGPGADRAGGDEPRRGGAAVHLRGDGEDAPDPHLREARRQRPRRGGRRRLRAGAADDALRLSRTAAARLPSPSGGLAGSSTGVTPRPQTRSRTRLSPTIRPSITMDAGSSISDVKTNVSEADDGGDHRERAGSRGSPRSSPGSAGGRP